MKFTKIPTTTFQQLQINAGVLMSSFDPTSPAVVDANILGATSGGVNFNAAPSFVDFGADIDNCPKNTKQLKKLEDWDVRLTGSFVTVSAALAQRLAAAADASGTKITPRRDLVMADFKDIWLVGDYSDHNSDNGGGYVAVHLMNTLSTGGFKIQTADKEKGKFAFEFTAHFSMDAQDTVPFEIYVSAGSDAPGIEISQSSIEISVGGTFKLDESHYPTASTVTWDSSDDDVATVTSGGVVTGVAAGYCIVTASITATNTYTDVCRVRVVAAS